MNFLLGLGLYLNYYLKYQFYFKEAKKDLISFLKNKKQGKVSIVSDTPYARRLYFHPEYTFKDDKNAHAGGLWFQPYISGNKKMFARNAFKRFIRSNYK